MSSPVPGSGTMTRRKPTSLNSRLGVVLLRSPAASRKSKLLKPPPRMPRKLPDDRLVPLPDVAALVEGAVGARRARVAAHVRQVADGAAAVGAVGRRGRRAHRPSGCSCPPGSRSSSREPAHRSRPPCTTRPRSVRKIVAPGVARHRRAVARRRRAAEQRVGARLRVAAALAVVQPVREAQRVVERHEVHGHVLAAGDRAVAEAARGCRCA